MSIRTELAAPAILVAVPQLGDPNFQRAVILVVEHAEEGSMGLVLNRPSDHDIGTFCDAQGMEYNGDTKEWVFVGGPVQTDRAFLLHTPGPKGPETETICDDLRLSYSLESLEMLADSPPESVRVYLGYAGWGPEQLGAEIAEGAWLLGVPSRSLVFEAPPERLWEIALQEMGIEPGLLLHSGAVH